MGIFIANEFVKRLPNGSKISVLDAGCSPGYNGAITTIQLYKRLRRTGAIVETHALDLLVPETLEGKTKNGITYFQHDLLSDELPQKQYDVIRATNVLFYFKPTDAQKVEDKLVERLRNGGIFVKTHSDPVASYGKQRVKTLNLYQKRGGELHLLQVLEPEPRASRTFVPCEIIKKRPADAAHLRESQAARKLAREMFVSMHR